MRKISLLFLLFLTACSPRIVESSTVTSSEMKERIVIREHVVMMPVMVPVPKEIHQVSVRADSAHAETSLAEADAWITDDVLNLRIRNKKDSLPAEVPVKETEKESVRDSVHTEFVDRPVYVEKSLSKIQRFDMAMGRMFIFLLIVAFIFVAGRIIKRFL